MPSSAGRTGGGARAALRSARTRSRRTCARQSAPEDVEKTLGNDALFGVVPVARSEVTILVDRLLEREELLLDALRVKLARLARRAGFHDVEHLFLDRVEPAPTV